MYRKHVSHQQRETIINLYTEQDMTFREIAEQFENFSTQIIRKVLLQANIPIRKRGMRRVRRVKLKTDIWEQAEPVVHLYTDKKLSPRKIAKQFGCSTTLILSILKKNKITKRSLKEARHTRRDKYKTKESIAWKIQQEMNRLPEPLGRFLHHIHLNGGLPNCRAFARRYKIPFEFVFDVSCQIRYLIRSEK